MCRGGCQNFPLFRGRHVNIPMSHRHRNLNLLDLRGGRSVRSALVFGNIIKAWPNMGQTLFNSSLIRCNDVDMNLRATSFVNLAPLETLGRPCIIQPSFICMYVYFMIYCIGSSMCFFITGSKIRHVPHQRCSCGTGDRYVYHTSHCQCEYFRFCFWISTCCRFDSIKFMDSTTQYCKLFLVRSPGSQVTLIVSTRFCLSVCPSVRPSVTKVY